MSASSAPRFKVGIAGMGAAGLAFIPALQRHTRFDWVACAAPVAEVRLQMQAALGVTVCASSTELLAHPGLDAVIVATPTDLHADHVVEACVAGKHMLVEKPMAARPAVPAAGLSAAAELEAKRARAGSAIPNEAAFQPFFGLTVVSCEGGDIRQSPTGLIIDAGGTQRRIELPTDRTPRDLVLDEFAAALSAESAPLHDGRWGLANLELCIAAMASSATGREVQLVAQVPVSG